MSLTCENTPKSCGRLFAIDTLAWDNVGAKQIGPGRCVNTELPGPRRSVKGTD